ncbi:hypothetical protein sos41_11860 [Alphaproteobacteria bacterium SO-S41]|nr:hypothetical protein sos41_11860 [Alphaproteobacteria bacterium SO-S41]
MTKTSKAAGHHVVLLNPLALTPKGSTMPIDLKVGAIVKLAAGSDAKDLGDSAREATSDEIENAADIFDLTAA